MSFLRSAAAIRSPLMAFLAMGAFWGAWHALVPDVKRAVGADDGELGAALLFVALGAVPAMVAGGRLVDRFRRALVPIGVLAFGVCAVLPALARTPVELGAALFALGLASGLMDVAMNARVGTIEAATGVRAMHLAHGLFAVVYLGAALATGLARDEGLGPLPVLLVVGLACGALALLARVLGEPDGSMTEAGDAMQEGQGGRVFTVPVVLLGLVAFAAFLAENGWQSWSALFLERTFGADPALGAMGPAAVGLALAVGRFAGQAIAARVEDRLLIAGATLTAIAGGTAVALAPGPNVVLAGLFVAAAGVSVIAPSALSLAGRMASPSQRGAAVATVGVIAYTGFFVGPALIGFVADAEGLRTALGSIVVVLALVVPCLVLHRTFANERAIEGVG